MSRRVVIRVDASAAIGVGHLMRMIALGQLLQDHAFAVDVITSDPTPQVSRQLVAEGFDLHPLPAGTVAGSAADADEVRTRSRHLGAAWVVLDGAAFSETYQRALLDGGARLMSVDDLAIGHFVSDVVLNQNYGAESAQYSIEPGTRTLLGTRYLLLRREFRLARPPVSPHAGARKRLLVTLGGGTEAGQAALEPIVRGLAAVAAADLQVRLVTGMQAVPSQVVQRACEETPGRFLIDRHVDTMADAMATADLAICSGGSTIWELLHMRVPFLAVALNPPQVAFLDVLDRDGLCRTLGSHSALTPNAVTAAVTTMLGDAALQQRMLAASAGLIDPARSSQALIDVFEHHAPKSAT